MDNEKQFMIRDNSGRGIVSTLPISHIRETWDLAFKDNPDDEYEMSLGEWLEDAEIGDEFDHEDEACTIIRTV